MILIVWLLSGSLISQTIIGPGLTKENLFNHLSANYKTNTTKIINKKNIQLNIIYK